MIMNNKWKIEKDEKRKKSEDTIPESLWEV
jgi:hypothetical protein